MRCLIILPALPHRPLSPLLIKCIETMEVGQCREYIYRHNEGTDYTLKCEKGPTFGELYIGIKGLGLFGGKRLWRNNGWIGGAVPGVYI